MCHMLVAEPAISKPNLRRQSKSEADDGLALNLEQLLRLGKYLGTADLALIQGVYERGMPPGRLARAMHTCPRVVRRRLNRIRMRLASPLFRFVVANRLRWPEHRRAIAEAVVLRGQPLRAAAMLAGVSLHHVRRELDRISAMCELERMQGCAS